MFFLISSRDLRLFNDDLQTNTDRIRQIGNRSQRQVTSTTQALRHEPLRLAKTLGDFRPRQSAFFNRTRQRLRHFQNELLLVQQSSVLGGRLVGSLTGLAVSGPAPARSYMSMVVLFESGKGLDRLPG